MTLFDWIKQQVSIVDVVGQYVRLQRLGNYLKASCMFHTETDASFTVSPDKGIFYCFGCHATGDVIAFIAKVEHLGQGEAVQLIVDRMGLTVPEALKKNFSSHDEHEKKDYFAACSFFEWWIGQQLARNQQARAYLQSRSISEELIASFAIGYMPSGPEAMGSFIRQAHAKGILAKHLVDAGVLLQSSTSVYHSPFEERIVFPIYDAAGRCVGFGGRIFHEGDSRPKYYNSKESDFFLKRQLLFGYHKAKSFFQKTERAFVVEGYVDCVMLAGSGIGEAVATLGTACTQEHLKLLARFVRKVFVVYDGDKAGQKATLRFAELCWDVNLELYVISLPGGHDPASFIQAGGDVNSLCDSAVDIFTFFVRSVSANFFKKTLSEKMEIGQRIASVIARVGNRFKQDLLISQAAQALQVQELSMRDLVVKAKEPQHSGPSQEQSGAVKEKTATVDDALVRGFRDVEEKIIGALLADYNKNGLLSMLDDRVQQFFDEDVRSVIQNIRDSNFECGEAGAFDALMERLSEEQRLWVMPAAVAHDQSLTRAEFQGLLVNFCRHKWRAMMVQLKSDLNKAHGGSDYDKMRALMASFSILREDMQNRGVV